MNDILEMPGGGKPPPYGFASNGIRSKIKSLLIENNLERKDIMLTPKEIAYEVTKALDEKKGMDIKLLKIDKVSSLLTTS